LFRPATADRLPVARPDLWEEGNGKEAKLGLWLVGRGEEKGVGRVGFKRQYRGLIDEYLGMSKRIEAITKHWTTTAQYHGGANAKTFRTNLRRAATAAETCAKLFAAFEGQDRADRFEDIDALRKAARLMESLADDFEVAQRKADRIQKDAEKKRAAQAEANRQAAIKELFGTDPVKEEVYRLAEDLVYFDRAGADEYARSKGCKRGLLGGSFRVSELTWFIQKDQFAQVLSIVADNRIETRWPGRAHEDGYGDRWFHCGWDDFLTWRSVRQQVRNVVEQARELGE